MNHCLTLQPPDILKMSIIRSMLSFYPAKHYIRRGFIKVTSNTAVLMENVSFKVVIKSK